MTDFRGKISRIDPTARGPLIIIYQVTAITCSNPADFIYDKPFTTILLSNITINASEISHYDTSYGNIKLQKNKQVDSKPWPSLGTLT